MNNQHIFNFDAEELKVTVPDELNNPFGGAIPEIAQLAARKFQAFITSVTPDWEHDFGLDKGKMFGVLVIQKKDDTYAYLGTVSGKLKGNSHCEKFVPSIFDDSTDHYFINRGMESLTEIGNQIKASTETAEINSLKAIRKQKSTDLQQRLFENYQILNRAGEEKNVLQIFQQSSHGHPPAAAGDCAAPKLLQYAFKHDLKPIALAEFWWGNSDKKKERKHVAFYPACKNKCRPILEYMLEDQELFSRVNEGENRNKI